MPCPPVEGDTDDTKWKFRVHATQNSGRSLYHMFEYDWYKLEVHC